MVSINKTDREVFGLIFMFYWTCLEISRSGGTGGVRGVGPPLELEIYLVKFLKIRKKEIFFSIRPPLGKNRSPAPAHELL